MELLFESARGLFAICAVAAAVDLLLGEARGALAFRSVCALAVATAAVRLLLRLLGARL